MQVRKAGKQQVKRPRPVIDRKLPRGITLLPIEEGQPKPYGIQWIVSGKRTSEFFETTEQLNTKAGRLIEARKDGALAMVPTPTEVASWRAFREAAGATPTHEVLAGWKSWTAAQGKPKSTLLVRPAVDDYLKIQLDRRDNKPFPLITPDTYRQKKCKLERFRERFGGQLMSDITGAMIKHWATVELAAIAPSFDGVTDHVRKVRELFYYYAKSIPDNPADDVELGEDVRDRPETMPVLDVAELLFYALEHEPSTVCRLATEIFVGVRTSTVGRLGREAFNLEDRGLDLAKSKTKKKSQHYIEAMPANFWDWIKAGWDDPEAFRPEVKSDWMHRKSRLFTAARIPLPKNGLRHAFCGYHCNAYGDAAKTALIMTHRNATMLWDRYRGKAKKVDGEWLFSLTPQNIKRMVKERRAHESQRAAAGTRTR